MHLQHSKCTPRSRTFSLCQEDLELELVVVDRLLEAKTKKGRKLFQKKVRRLLKAKSKKDQLSEEKSAPQTKSWLRLCSHTDS